MTSREPASPILRFLLGAGGLALLLFFMREAADLMNTGHSVQVDEDSPENIADE